jgi:hypothetical protein
MIFGAISKEIEKVICQNMAVMFDRKSDRLIDSIGQTIQTKLDSSKEFETMVRSKIESVIAEKLNTYYDLDKNPDAAKGLQELIQPIIEKSLATTLQPLLEKAIADTMAQYEQRAAAQGPVTGVPAQGLKKGGSSSLRGRRRRLRSKRTRSLRSRSNSHRSHPSAWTRRQPSGAWGWRTTRSHRTL